MGHLKKSDLTGHLLKNAAGHLVNGCAGAPVNNCHSCIPPIPDTLYVTLGGLSGDFAGYNGTHQLEWDNACVWRIYFDAPNDYPTIILHYYAYLQYGWRLRLLIDFVGATTGCFIGWGRNDEHFDYWCDPDGNYSANDVATRCQLNRCGDPSSCDGYLLSTCVVSETSP